MLQWIGDRYIPDISLEEIGAEIHYEHIHRYLFAALFVKNRVVLDLGCGVGYGSYILSRCAKRVVGFDMDEKAIKRAESKYIRNNLEFITGSVTKIPINGSEIFDVAICFEHISEQERMIEEIKRVLKKDGIFIVSTPNKKLFHKKELYFDEFYKLLKKYFKYVYLFGQRAYPSSQIWNLMEENGKNSEIIVDRSDKTGFVQTDYDKKEPMYFIAVASDTAVDISKIWFKSYLYDEISAKNKQIKKLSEENIRLSIELDSIKSSLTWTVAMKWQSFVERVAPLGTMRRKWYDFGVTGLRILVNEGFRELINSYKDYKRLKKLEKYKERLINPHINKEKELIFPKNQNPMVSIIIPVYNNVEYTINCLTSILRNTTNSYEVIVIDDNSNDETQEILEKKVKNIKIIRNNTNLGFVDSCNKGASLSAGKYLVFLNNDTIVTENWLEPLLNTIEKDNVGAVGAKLIYPSGILQEAGSIIWKDSSGWNYGKYDDPEKPEYNFVREVDYCSGAALIVKRDIFEKIGGFSKEFRPGYYEDTDLCFSIRNMGFRVLYQPKSVVIHYEGVTSGTDTHTGVKRYQEINKKKFLKKWRKILENEHYQPEPSLLFLARSKRKGKNILIIDQHIPTFDRDAGSYRMFNILKILIEQGHNVVIVGDNLMRLEPYTSVLQQLGAEVLYAPYTVCIKDYLKKYGGFFDLVILSRLHIAIKHFSSVKQYCKKAKLIFDTVDLQFLRERRRAHVEKNPRVMKNAERLKKLELKLAQACDLTLVVSPVEQEIILKEYPSARVMVLSNIHKVTIPNNGYQERKHIMFLGSFAHLPNIDAVKWFVEKIFPIIKSKLLYIKFFIVGSSPPKDIISLKSEDIIVTGYVDDLKPYFETSRVFVSPLRYGSGVKGKICEAMAHGLPVITTNIGAEGMGLIDGETALIADDPLEFANKVIKLYKDRKLWEKLSKNSIEHIQQNFLYDIARVKIQEIGIYKVY